jgi:hypothetical protein
MAKTDKNKEFILSKEEKLSICRNTYNRIFNIPSDDLRHCSFICVAIEAELPYEWTEKKVKAHMVIPELLDYKPSDRKPNNHWFTIDEDGMNKRKEILLDLIKRFS